MGEGTEKENRIIVEWFIIKYLSQGILLEINISNNKRKYRIEASKNIN